MDNNKSFFRTKNIFEKLFLISVAYLVFFIATASAGLIDNKKFSSAILMIPVMPFYVCAILFSSIYLYKLSVHFIEEAKNRNLFRLIIGFITGTLGLILALFILLRGFIEAPFWQKPRLSLEYYDWYDYFLWAVAVVFFVMCSLIRTKKD